jgi:hypothetical protein
MLLLLLLLLLLFEDINKRFFFKYETLNLLVKVKVKMAKYTKEEAATAQRVCRSTALLLL